MEFPKFSRSRRRRSRIYVSSVGSARKTHLFARACDWQVFKNRVISHFLRHCRKTGSFFSHNCTAMALNFLARAFGARVHLSLVSGGARKKHMFARACSWQVFKNRLIWHFLQNCSKTRSIFPHNCASMSQICSLTPSTLAYICLL